MSSDILVRLVNVTKYFRHVSGFNKLRDFIVPESKNHHVEVKNATIHLYRGEILGLIGLPDSGKSVVGKLIAKVVEPNEGKVKNDQLTFLASNNHIFGGVYSVKQLIETLFLSYNVPLAEFNEKRINVLNFAELKDKERTKTNELTMDEASRLLISLTYFLKPTVIIYDDLYRHLDDTFKEKFKMVLDLLKKEGKTIVIIDSDVALIHEKANYITWMSHGQVRKTGTPAEVLPLYEKYLKDFKSCRTEDEKNLFDLNYKMSRSLTHDEGDKLSRIKKYGSNLVDSELQKLFVYSFMLLCGIGLMILLMINGVGMTEKQESVDNTGIVKKKETVFTDKFALIIASNDTVIQNKKAKYSIPRGTVLPISGLSDKEYRINYKKDDVIGERKAFAYINPAALYDEMTFSDVEVYMYSNYANYREFFNSFIGKSHSTINKELYPETKDRYKVKLTKNNIYLHFDDHDELNAISFPIVNKDKLKKKFNIDSNLWIIKLGDGYAVADFDKNEWEYIQM